MSDDELEDCCQCAHLRASLGASQALHTAERERADIAEAERDVLRSNQLGPVPEGPLKALGAWVADHTDDDTWPAAERYLNAALAELTAERERAERCRNSVVEACVEYPNVGEYIAQVEAERDALRERVARLVGAMEQIAQLDYTRGAVNMAATKANAIARAALGEGK